MIYEARLVTIVESYLFNNVNYSSEVSRSENYDNISENMMLKNNGVNTENTDEVLELSLIHI